MPFVSVCLRGASYFSSIFTASNADSQQTALALFPGNENTKELWETFDNNRRLFQETRNRNKKFLVVASVETGLYIIKNA